MTTTALARQAILGRFVAVWGASPTWETPYVFDNEAYEPPEEAAASSSWVRLMLVMTPGGQDTLGPAGARGYERNGVAVLEINAQRNKGALRADQLVAKFRASFEGVSFTDSGGGTIHFFDCQENAIGYEGAFYRVNASAQFRFYETK